mgnify:CR=1 FL=1
MTKQEVIREACVKHNLIVIDGHGRWVPCWMCGDPVYVPMDFDYRAEKPVCSTGCAREKREHYS